MAMAMAAAATTFFVFMGLLGRGGLAVMVAAATAPFFFGLGILATEQLGEIADLDHIRIFLWRAPKFNNTHYHYRVGAVKPRRLVFRGLGH